MELASMMPSVSEKVNRWSSESRDTSSLDVFAES